MLEGTQEVRQVRAAVIGSLTVFGLLAVAWLAGVIGTIHALTTGH
jgi:hypothetical protein